MFSAEWLCHTAVIARWTASSMHTVETKLHNISNPTSFVSLCPRQLPLPSQQTSNVPKDWGPSPSKECNHRLRLLLRRRLTSRSSLERPSSTGLPPCPWAMASTPAKCLSKPTAIHIHLPKAKLSEQVRDPCRFRALWSYFCTFTCEQVLVLNLVTSRRVEELPFIISQSEKVDNKRRLQYFQCSVVSFIITTWDNTIPLKELAT